jgi:hypothetical protein
LPQLPRPSLGSSHFDSSSFVSHQLWTLFKAPIQNPSEQSSSSFENRKYGTDEIFRIKTPIVSSFALKQFDRWFDYAHPAALPDKQVE